MNTKQLPSILLVFMSFITVSVIGQEVNFTLKPVAKKKYDIQVNTQTDVVQSMAGMEMKVDVKSTATALMEIEEVYPNGNFTLLSTWNEIEAFTSAMGKDTTLRSENLDIVMKTTYDKSGKIIKIERIDTSNSSDPAFAMAEQLAKNLKLPILPAKTIHKGESWESHSTDTIQPAEFPMTMIINTEDKNTFVGTVTASGVEYYQVKRTSPTKVTGEGEQGGMNMLVEGTGMSEGSLILDKTTLFPAKIEENTGMDMSLMISGVQSMAIPMTQNTTTKITFTEVK